MAGSGHKIVEGPLYSLSIINHMESVLGVNSKDAIIKHKSKDHYFMMSP